MIDQILIMNDGGLPIYDWKPPGKGSDSNLVSGFLTALNMFAAGERGEQMKKLTMDPTTFIFERAADLIFVILTKDPEFEKVINLILPEVKLQFLQEYGEAARQFRGDLSRFGGFTSNVERILASFGYFDYLRIKSVFDQDESLKCVLFLNSVTGDALYVKAREYLDRKALGFQGLIVTKAVDRILRDAFRETPQFCVVLSEKLRCLMLKATEKIVLVAETLYGHSDLPAWQIASDKKLQTLVKKPGQFLAHVSGDFVLFDEAGKILLNYDRQDHLRGRQSFADCITLLQSAKTTIAGIYKENILGAFLASDAHVYFIFPVASAFALILLPDQEASTLKHLFEKRGRFENMNQKECDVMIHTLDRVNKFRGL